MDEADPEGRGGIEALAGDEVATGRALADLAEHVGRDHGGGDPELDLGEPEHRSLVGERDVGRRDEARPAADRMPLDDGDHRRGTRVDRVEHAAQRVGVGDILVVGERDRLPHPFDVGTRTEARALADENDRPSLADVDERLRQLGDRGRVEGVARLGPREDDPEDVVVAFDS